MYLIFHPLISEDLIKIDKKEKKRESGSLMVYFCKVYHRWKNQPSKYIQSYTGNINIIKHEVKLN